MYDARSCTVMVCAVQFAYRNALMLLIRHSETVSTRVLVPTLWPVTIAESFNLFALPTARDISAFVVTYLAGLSTSVVQPLLLTATAFRAKRSVERKCCGWFAAANSAADEDADSGHSAAHLTALTEYRYRGATAFFYTLCAHMEAQIMYIVLAPALRYGPNHDWYSISVALVRQPDGSYVGGSDMVDEGQFAASIVFSVIQLVSAFIQMIVFRVVLRRCTWCRPPRHHRPDTDHADANANAQGSGCCGGLCAPAAADGGPEEGPDYFRTGYYVTREVYPLLCFIVQTVTFFVPLIIFRHFRLFE
jgi:hypothetical protein